MDRATSLFLPLIVTVFSQIFLILPIITIPFIPLFIGITIVPFKIEIKVNLSFLKGIYVSKWHWKHKIISLSISK